MYEDSECTVFESGSKYENENKTMKIRENAVHLISKRYTNYARIKVLLTFLRKT